MSVRLAAGDRVASRRGAPNAVPVATVAAFGFALAAFLAYLVARVPVEAAVLPSGERLQHWPAIVVAVAVVSAVDAVAIRAWRHHPTASPVRVRATRTEPVGFLPAGLRLRRVPRRVAVITAIASATLLDGAAVLHLPLWLIALLALLPWVPLLWLETVWKYEHYGFFSALFVLTLLQVGHMTEHTVQVGQLMATHGILARSHGVFGQLDFETVHFYWDSAVWIGIAVLLLRFRENRWLWASFVAASLHEVEHLYLYYLYLMHGGYYLEGGFAGIMGRGGVVGSPLYRPYLHFTYNVFVIVPLVVACWIEARRVFDSRPT
jgi:hypothetical protein